jgi:hypothetical protein
MMSKKIVLLLVCLLIFSVISCPSHSTGGAPGVQEGECRFQGQNTKAVRISTPFEKNKTLRKKKTSGDSSDVTIDMSCISGSEKCVILTFTSKVFPQLVPQLEFVFFSF